MKTMKIYFAFLNLSFSSILFAQSPAITNWLQNTTQTGSYYVSGNSTAIDNGIVYNCQEVSYSTNFVYVKTHGVPSYTTGPFLDGNPSQAQDQNAIFRFPLFPSEQVDPKTPTTMGNIGVFINGTALFDYRDGVAWNSSTNSLCGGPGNPPCPGGPTATMDWNRDAIPAEMAGFDCSKGHPAMGNYHHHQNPSAFKLDLNVVSNICNLYDADGLYAIDPNQHSPLLGFAYDGFPIYGAYAFQNTDGTGGIVRMKSSYELGTSSDRSTWPDGTDVDDGPAFNATYFRGYFREDYLFVPHAEPDYLDEHNGRFCVTPEYPAGTYAYFCTVDDNWNSAYPYAVGPTFFGVWQDRKVTSITESVTVYNGGTNDIDVIDIMDDLKVFPNPASDIIAVQITGIAKEEIEFVLSDTKGRVVRTSKLHAGQTLAYFDVSTLYGGIYFLSTAGNSKKNAIKVLVD